MTRWHDVGIFFSAGGVPGGTDSGKCSGKQWIRLAFRLSLPACQAAAAPGSTPTSVGDPWLCEPPQNSVAAQLPAKGVCL